MDQGEGRHQVSRATSESLDELHGIVAEVLKAGLDSDEVSPQMIAQAIKFLKENGIDAPATSKRMQDLSLALDELDVDEAAHDMAET